MKNSLKMAKLDYLSAKPNFWFMPGIALIGIPFALNGQIGTGMAMIGLYASSFSTMMTNSIFHIQDKNDLDKLYGSVALDLKNIVQGRFIFAVLSFFLSFFIPIAVWFCFLLFQNTMLDFLFAGAVFVMSFLLFTLLAGIGMPLYFKLGYAKARILYPFCFIPMLCLLAGLFAFPSVAEAAWIFVSGIGLPAVAGIMVFAGCAVLYVSCRISIAAYRKRVY